MCLTLLSSGCGASAVGPSVIPGALQEYRDPAGRFVFSYPESFGTVSVGTDNGFGNRVAALRFSVFSSQGNGGEAVVGQGRPSLDVMAAGGLYDDILSGTLPSAMKALVETALPPLTPANLCDQIGREQHLDVSSPPFAALTAAQRTALADLDRMGNVAPTVRRCSQTGDTITFEKEAAVVPGGPRRRTYGAVRFLSGRYTTFQLIRGGANVDEPLLQQLELVVKSFATQ